MKKYGFRYINDNEIISRKMFNDIDEAIEYFASVKKLSKTNFLKIYKVILIDGR